MNSKNWANISTPARRLTSQWSGRLRAAHSGAAHRRVRRMKRLIAVLIGLLSSSTIADESVGARSDSHEYTLTIGEEAAFEAKSETGSLSVVFEDDGSTGYFYALDYSKTDQPIQEAMHIYDVKSVIGKSKTSAVRITWSADGKKAGLWINDYPHAVFDFAARRGYCRSNYPSPQKWNASDFAWRDSALDLIK